MRAEQGDPESRGRRGSGPRACGRRGGGPGGGGPGGGRYRRAILETSILALLAESTSHGYDLVEQIDGLAADLVCVDPGTMYRLLRAMEEQGLVSSSWQTPEAGPSRRVYTISEQGIAALEESAGSLSQRAAALQRLADHAAKAAAESRASGSQVEPVAPEV